MKTEDQIKERIENHIHSIEYYRELILFDVENKNNSSISTLVERVKEQRAKINALEWVLENE